MRLVGANVLVVPPFECAWLMGDEARFAEPGNSCVSFEAMTDHDVTVVFKELAGAKHYSTDSEPSYTVILGSHCNRRFKILVDGETVVDVARVTLQPSIFETYWINIFDGVITVGKGDPGKGIIYEWVDSTPHCNVQYVGLSSWDKHVVYRNIQVLPPLQPPRKHWPDDVGGFAQYLECEELSDLKFVVGLEQTIVPAHKVLLALCCSKSLGSCTSPSEVVHLPLTKYSMLHALLQCIYTGHTQVDVSEVDDLRDLAEEFGHQGLVSRLEEIKTLTGKGSDEVSEAEGRPPQVHVDLRNTTGEPETQEAFCLHVPIDAGKLGKLLESGDFSDVELSVDGYSNVIRAHRLILSVWSHPFAKMFTNGMRESKMADILIREVGPEPLLAMINFMYKGHIELDGRDDMGSVLLPLLILADRFGMQLLQQKCINNIVDSLTKDSACAVLRVAEAMPICEQLCERCEELCARHFNFCTAAPALAFRQLEASSLQKILQHLDLQVTSEEKVLDAVISWAAKNDGVTNWQEANAYLNDPLEDSLFSDKWVALGNLLPLVRFPLMSLSVLQQLKASHLTRHIQVLEELVLEALEYLSQGSQFIASQSDMLAVLDMSKNGRLVTFPKTSLKFTPRPWKYKELQYICDGDCNGVFYHIGTGCRRHSWMNPVLTKRLTVSTSSPPVRFTDVKSLVSRNYQGTSFAGPCWEHGQMCSWWKVDLGKDHKLMCNYYTVRQDGSANFMRSWSLQGSNNGDNWTELCSHQNERTICHPGQYASWPVHGAAAYLPFRYFRIILTRPTTSSINPWNFCLCYLELYGYFQ